jgi:DNA-binding transcriptional LysR family regulator
MRLRHIEVFNAVMLTGSVSAAARLINVTQPAVSRVLAHAEVQLGFKLFERNHNRLVPTGEALTLYPHIQRLFACLEDVQRLSATLKSGDDTKALRVACILTLGHEVLPRAMRLFAKQHPQVAVSIKTMHSEQMLSALALQEADVGFLYSPAAHPALACEPLAQAGIVCVATKGALPAACVARGAMTLQALAGLPVIGLDSTHAVGVAIGQACREAGVGLTSPITVQTYQAALSLAHHGLGVAVVDGCTALSADRERVDVLALEPAIPVRIEAVRASAGTHSVAARAFTRAVQQVLHDALGTGTGTPRTSGARASTAVPGRRPGRAR